MTAGLGLDRILADRVAVVLGATGWIGRAVCKDLLDSGASVVMVARDVDRLEALRAELGASERSIVVAADVTSQLQVDDARIAAIERFGHVDLVVVSAGVITGSAFDDGIPADWAEMIDVNLRGLLHASQAFADPLLRSAQDDLLADLILLGSVTEETHTPKFAVFNAISAAVKQLARTLRHEYGPRGLRVHVVESGFLQPDLRTTDGSSKDPRSDRSQSPVTPEAIAAAVVLAAALPHGSNLAEVLILPTEAG